MEKANERDIEELVAKRMESWQMPFDQDQPARAKAKIMDIIGKEAKSEKQNAKIISPKFWMRVAAGIAVILAIPIAIGILGKIEIDNTLTKQMAHILPDGSKITLNPESSLSYNALLWGITRDLDFTGEAYFDVAKGSTFNVETPKGAISVLGTQFTIWADEDDLMVHCNEGKVQVSNGNDNVLLNKNQFTHHQGDGLSPEKKLEHEGFLSPRKNLDILTYNEVPLSVVLQELELVLDTEIMCGLDIDNLTYSGTLSTLELDTCFDVLCKPFSANYKRNPDGIFEIYE
jgi:ferric-dicitrate binding protein FerR (iron transport regulator)